MLTLHKLSIADHLKTYVCFVPGILLELYSSYRLVWLICFVCGIIAVILSVPLLMQQRKKKINRKQINADGTPGTDINLNVDNCEI